jgi:2-polyprenyl-3-methyl-5-hydroxy-6-metoxy-1,4-benzoquinol methylase
MNKNQVLHNHLKPYKKVKDHFLSREEFDVLYNEEFEMLVTSPVPENLDSYYDSAAYISHSNQKKGIFEKTYGLVKSIALKRKLKLINSFELPGKSLLDIGAATGDFLATCKNGGWDVTGTEPNEKARSIASHQGIELLENSNGLKKQSFDVITLWHVLEHIENLSEFISQLNELLKDNGRIVVAVPNYKSFDAEYYNEFWAAYDVPRHLWHFSQESIVKLFSKENIVVDKILPMKFDAFYVSLLSEKYNSGKMNPIKAFFIGLKSNRKAKRTGEYSSLIYVLKKVK